MSQAGKFALSAAELQSFRDNGFVGPFDACTPEEMREMWTRARFKLLRRERAAFPDSKLNYDRHLDVPELRSHVSRPQIVDRLRSILGNDMLCWRSEMFSKGPGQVGTGWHQVETFVVGGESGSQQQQLVPTVRLDDTPIELTVWCAVTPATIANGCMKFMAGSHRQWFFNEHGPMKYRPDEGGSSSFFGYDYDDLKLDPNWQPDESKATTVTCLPGQFIIFTAKCMHGSHGNVTDLTRLAYVSRYVPTSVKVYPSMTQFAEFGESFTLDRHKSLLVSGQDDFEHNRIIPVASREFLDSPVPSFATEASHAE